MKKLLNILVMVLVTISLIGCGQNNEEVINSEIESNDEISEEQEAIELDTELETTLDFPEKDIIIIIPFDAGGGTDTCGRLFIASLEKYISGVNLVPKNIKGASGTVGANTLFNSNADGYTLMVAPASFPVAYIMGKFDKTYEDYSPVCRFATSNMAFYVKGDSKYNNMEDFIAEAKNSQGEMKVGVSSGTLLHFATLAIEKENDVTFKKVSIGGSTPKPPELISGRIEGYIGSTSEGKPFVDSGEFKALGLFGEERIDVLPDVPTFKEMGYPYAFTQSFGIWAPKDVPEEIINYISEAALKACNDPDYIAALEPLGIKSSYLNSVDYKEHLKEAFEECESVSSLLDISTTN